MALRFPLSENRPKSLDRLAKGRQSGWSLPVLILRGDQQSIRGLPEPIDGIAIREEENPNILTRPASLEEAWIESKPFGEFPIQTSHLDSIGRYRLSKKQEFR